MADHVIDKFTYDGETYILQDNTSGYTSNTGTISKVQTTAGAHSTVSVSSGTVSFNVPTTAAHVGAAASSHTHGDITNAGDITATSTIASGDRLIINDQSESKITNSSITFGSSVNQYLANDGTWQSIPSSDVFFINITVSFSNGTTIYSSDKTWTETMTAMTNGKLIVANVGNSGQNLSIGKYINGSGTNQYIEFLSPIYSRVSTTGKQNLSYAVYRFYSDNTVAYIDGFSFQQNLLAGTGISLDYTTDNGTYRPRINVNIDGTTIVADANGVLSAASTGGSVTIPEAHSLTYTPSDTSWLVNNVGLGIDVLRSTLKNQYVLKEQSYIYNGSTYSSNIDHDGGDGIILESRNDHSEEDYELTQMALGYQNQFRVIATDFTPPSSQLSSSLIISPNSIHLSGTNNSIYLNASAGLMSLNASTVSITGVKTPINSGDAANKAYVDNKNYTQYNTTSLTRPSISLNANERIVVTDNSITGTEGDTVSDFLQAIVNLVYPVGSYYETSDTTFDPNTAWTGTWVLETEGQVHVSAGENYTAGNTGGSVSTTLTESHLPSISGTVRLGAGITKNLASANMITSVSGKATSATHNVTACHVTTSTTANQTVSDQFSISFGSATPTAVSHMQPYIAVNRWHRTA